MLLHHADCLFSPRVLPKRPAVVCVRSKTFRYTLSIYLQIFYSYLDSIHRYSRHGGDDENPSHEEYFRHQCTDPILSRKSHRRHAGRRFMSRSVYPGSRCEQTGTSRIYATSRSGGLHNSTLALAALLPHRSSSSSSLLLSSSLSPPLSLPFFFFFLLSFFYYFRSQA